MSEEKKKIEAVLFTTGRLMTSEEIANATGLTVDVIKNLLTELKNDYDQKDSAMTIQQVDDKFKLNVKKEYGQITNKLVSTSELDSPTTKTLAIIAFKNPALQSDVIKIRGNKAYDHIERLKSEGLVTSERHGRTRLLKLTPKFYEYFDTAEPAIKEKFKEIEDKYKEQEQQEKQASAQNNMEKVETREEKQEIPQEQSQPITEEKPVEVQITEAPVQETSEENLNTTKTEQNNA